MLQLLSILMSVMLYFPSVQAIPCPSRYICDRSIVSDASCEFADQAAQATGWWNSDELRLTCTLPEFNITVEFEPSGNEDAVIGRTRDELSKECKNYPDCVQKYNCASKGACR